MFVCACSFLWICFCTVWDCSSCLGDSGDPHQVVVAGAQQVVSSFQASLGISGDSEGSRSDSVEIVCRSQIRGIGVRGTCVDLRRTQGGLVESVLE